MPDYEFTHDPVSGQQVTDALALMEKRRPGLRTQRVLNFGVVEVVDVMPRLIPIDLSADNSPLRCDLAIPQAARISYQGGTKKASSDVGLIDNLIRNQHTSPVEMVELKWRLRMPIFVMRQHVRHRMSSMNEESARYSELASDFYIPDPAHWAMNTTADKQATVKQDLDPRVVGKLYDWIHEHNIEAYRLYQHLLDGSEDADGDIVIPGIAREQARMILGVNIYTSCIWKIDLKNLLHYARLRADAHAQYEIRVYAEAMIKQLEYLCPAAMASFRDHFMDGVNIAASEITVYVQLLNGEWNEAVLVAKRLGWTHRRSVEFIKKIAKLPAQTATGSWLQLDIHGMFLAGMKEIEK